MPVNNDSVKWRLNPIVIYGNNVKCNKLCSYTTNIWRNIRLLNINIIIKNIYILIQYLINLEINLMTNLMTNTETWLWNTIQYIIIILF